MVWSESPLKSTWHVFSRALFANESVARCPRFLRRVLNLEFHMLLSTTFSAVRSHIPEPDSNNRTSFVSRVHKPRRNAFVAELITGQLNFSYPSLVLCSCQMPRCTLEVTQCLTLGETTVSGIWSKDTAMTHKGVRGKRS